MLKNLDLKCYLGNNITLITGFSIILYVNWVHNILSIIWAMGEGKEGSWLTLISGISLLDQIVRFYKLFIEMMNANWIKFRFILKNSTLIASSWLQTIDSFIGRFNQLFIIDVYHFLILYKIWMTFIALYTRNYQ